MKLRRFEYHAPADLESACRLLAEHPDSAAVLAGGTDLLVDLKEGALRREHLVSLKEIEAVRGIDYDRESGLSIGAAVTHNEVARSETVRRLYPGLAEAARSVAGAQVRNRGTIGGNICSAVSSADVPPILLALDAEFRIVGADGERLLPASSFFLGPRRTALRRGEILAAIHLTPPAEGTGTCYRKFALRDASALAVAGAAAAVVMDGGRCLEGRIALGAVAPTPMLAAKASGLLRGVEVDETLARKVGAVAREECKPISDIRGSAEFRRELVEELTRRALLEAVERAK